MPKSNFFISLLGNFLLALLVALPLHPQTVVPQLVKHKGKLSLAPGDPVPATISVTATIYESDSGGTGLFAETQNVQPDAEGRYTVTIGAATTGGIPLEPFRTGQARWLGITIDSDPELPRTLILAVPYALKASDADTLGGRPATDFALASAVTPVTGTPDALAKFGADGTITSSPLGANVAGDLAIATPGAGIAFPDGSRQISAAAPLTSSGALILGGLTPQHAQPIIFAAGAADLSNGGNVASITLHDTSTQHRFGEIAFQDFTYSDIWALAQDPYFQNTEDLRLRRKGHEVLTFVPFGDDGSHVSANFFGYPFRLERSGPTRLEFRDNSFANPNGLWGLISGGDSFFIGKNTAADGSFSTWSSGLSIDPNLNLNLSSGKLRIAPWENARLELRTNSSTLPDGLWDLQLSNVGLRFRRNTDVTGNFGAYATALWMKPNGDVEFPAGKLIGNGAGLTGVNAATIGGKTLAELGDITGVTAGSGLTGGGAAGAVSLGLNTAFTDARYASLTAANTYQGNQTILGDLVARSLTTTTGNSTFNAQRLRVQSPSGSRLELRNTATTFPDGLWDLVLASQGLLIRKNTAAAGDFSTNFPALEVNNSGAVTIGQGQLRAPQGISVGQGVAAGSSGIKHRRQTVVLAAAAKSDVVVNWTGAFADTHYTAVCSVYSIEGEVRLLTQKAQTTSGLTVRLSNESSTAPARAQIHCMGMHD